MGLGNIEALYGVHRAISAIGSSSNSEDPNKAPGRKKKKKKRGLTYTPWLPEDRRRSTS